MTGTGREGKEEGVPHSKSSNGSITKIGVMDKFHCITTGPISYSDAGQSDNLATVTVFCPKKDHLFRDGE